MKIETPTIYPTKRMYVVPDVAEIQDELITDKERTLVWLLATASPLKQEQYVSTKSC